MAELVVLEAGDGRIFPRADLRAGRRVTSETVERIGLEIGGALRKVGFGVDDELVGDRFADVMTRLRRVAQAVDRDL